MALVKFSLNLKKISGFPISSLFFFSSHMKCWPDGTLFYARLEYLVPCISSSFTVKSSSSLCPTFIALSWLISSCQNFLRSLSFLSVLATISPLQSNLWQFRFLVHHSCLFSDLCTSWEMCVCFPCICECCSKIIPFNFTFTRDFLLSSLFCQ